MTDISQRLQDLISNNSELGSRVLSLLLVSSGNAKEIIDTINKQATTSKNDLKSITKIPTATITTTSSNNRSNSSSSSISSSASNSNTYENININKKRSLSSSEDDEINDYDDEELSKMEKRRKNTEASARFRKRRKEREQAKLNQLENLNVQIKSFYDKIDLLIDENKYWKQKLKEVNERKSNELLNNIKLKNISKP